MTRSIPVLALFGLGMVVPLSSQQRLQDPLAIVAGGELPFHPDSSGFGDVRLRVDPAMNRNGVRIVDSPDLTLGSSTAKSVASWTFAGSNNQFDLTVRFRRNAESACSQDRNQSFEIRPPTEITVYAKPDSTCEPLTEKVEGLIERSIVEGTVLCECPSGHELPGVVLFLRSIEPKPNEVFRTLRTDSMGHFRIDGLAVGTYELTLTANAFGARIFTLRVTDKIDMSPVVMTLPPEPNLAEPPPAVVVQAGLPTYPIEARDAGIDGTVSLRLSMRGSAVIDINTQSTADILARAAVANVRSWRLADVREPVLQVKFVYRLLPSDCDPDQRQVVRIQFPAEIEVSAKKVRPCLRFSLTEPAKGSWQP